jgi:hypothetical protein
MRTSLSRSTRLAGLSVAVLAACSSGSTSNGGDSPLDASLRADQGGMAGMIPAGGMGGEPMGGTPVAGEGGAGGAPVAGTGGTGGTPVGGTGGTPVGGTGGTPVGGTGGEGGAIGPVDMGVTPDLAPDVPPPPDLGRLVINEIDYDQVSSDTAEYIELYNAADAPSRLRGKRLELVNGSNQDVYASYDLGAIAAELPAHGYLVIGAADVLAALPEGTLSLALDTGIQNGAPDGARIIDAFVAPEAHVDGLAWEGSLANVGEGDGAPGDTEGGPGAIGRCPNAVDTDDNAADFVEIVNSPGVENVCPPPAPHMLTLTIDPVEVPARSPFEVTVALDLPAGMDGLPLVFDFTPAAGARGPDAALIDAGQLDGTFVFFAGATPGPVHLVVESPDLNLTAEADFTIIDPLPVQRTPLVVNEVDVDQPGVDDGEFIEIHNPTDLDAPLVALELQLVNGTTGAIYDTYDLELLGEVLPAHGYLVIGDTELVVDLPPDVLRAELTGSIQNDAGHGVRIVDVLTDMPVVLDTVAFETNPGMLAEGRPTRVRDTGADAPYTVARCPNAADTGDNAADFAFARPTVGAPNDCLPELGLTLTPPQVLVGAAFEARVELPFPAPAGGEAVSFTLAPAGGSCAADARIAEGTRVAIVDCVGPDAAGDYTVTAETATAQAEAALSVIEAPPVPAHPIINEVDYDQPATDTTDFIEILNPTEDVLDLAPFSVQIINGSDGSVIDEYELGLAADRLPAGGTLVIGMDDVLAALPANVPAIPMSGPTAGGLQNGPDAVRLVQRLPGGVEFIDGLAYEGSVRGAGEGNPPALNDAAADLAFSLGRCPNGVDTDDNASDFRLGAPTPGAVNDCPAALAAVVDPAAVLSGQRFTLTVSLPVPNDGADLPIVVAQNPMARVTCPLDAIIANGARTAQLVCTAGDVAGEVALDITAGGLHAQATVTVQALPAGRGGLVINEIDPDQPGADNGDFLEILNAGNAAVALDGLVVELVNGANGDVYGTINLSAAGAGAMLAPGGYLVVTHEQSIVNALPAGVLGIRTADVFQNGPDGVRLVDQNAETTLDAMSYGASINGLTEGRFAPLDNGFAGSLGRCPNGVDSQDNARDFVFGTPTPGVANDCAN